jgi:hypothetical protein
MRQGVSATLNGSMSSEKNGVFAALAVLNIHANSTLVGSKYGVF